MMYIGREARAQGSGEGQAGGSARKPLSLERERTPRDCPSGSASVGVSSEISVLWLSGLDSEFSNVFSNASGRAGESPASRHRVADDGSRCRWVAMLV